MIDTDTNAPAFGGEATEKATPDVSAGTGTVAPESSQDGQERAGISQESTEGSQAEAQSSRPRGPTKLDTIRELRAKLRERDQRYGSEIEQLRTQMEELMSFVRSGKNGQKSSRTFWEAPEEVLDEKLSSGLTAMEQRLLEKIEQRETQNQETSEWKLEASKATEFIKSQKGMTEDDREELAEIVRNNPVMMQLRPMERAEYALFLWNKEKGITDKSSIKAKAATVVGAPPSYDGKKTWTEAEIEQAIKRYPTDPRRWTPEMKTEIDKLDNEIHQAYREGRVKK